MAVQDPVLYNDWWVYLRDMIRSPWGSVHLNPSDLQIHNAYKMRSALQAQGYCDKALAGVIGSAQQESGLTTGAIERTSVFPQGAETLAECTNATMEQYYTADPGADWGLGLLQWDRKSSISPFCHVIVSTAVRQNMLWYDGDLQMYRLELEYTTDGTYHFWANNYGPDLTWAVFKDIENSRFSHYDAGECAAVWDACWEKSSGSGREIKRDNANFWYQYFIDHPIPPVQPLKPSIICSIINKRKVIKSVYYS